MLVLAQLFFVVVLTRVPQFMRLSFYPSFAAMTFPFVITATALGQAIAFFRESGIYVHQAFDVLVAVETLIAIAMVLFVFAHYLRFLFRAPQEAAVASRRAACPRGFSTGCRLRAQPRVPSLRLSWKRGCRRQPKASPRRAGRRFGQGAGQDPPIRSPGRTPRPWAILARVATLMVREPSSTSSKQDALRPTIIAKLRREMPLLFLSAFIRTPISDSTPSIGSPPFHHA